MFLQTLTFEIKSKDLTSVLYWFGCKTLTPVRRLDHFPMQLLIVMRSWGLGGGGGLN